MGILLSTLGGDTPLGGVSEADLEQARHLRQEAFGIQDEARGYAEQSQAAYRGGDGGEAKTLSEMKNAAHERANEKHAQAEKMIFAFYNDPARLSAHNSMRPGDKWIDFHELIQKEVQQRLDALKANPGDASRWVFIVGRGNHSGPHGPVLKGLVEKWCHDNNFQYAVDEPTVGCITVTVSPGAGPAFPCCPIL